MAKKPASKLKSELSPQFEVQAIILSRFDVMQFPNAADETERRLGLDCFITPVAAAEETDEKGTSIYYGSACYRCSRDGDEERTAVRMAAMYSFAFSCDSDVQEHLDQVSRTVASTSVWSQFMNLFGVANTQMRSRLPLLPPVSGSLQQCSVEEIVELFSAFVPSDNAEQPSD